MKRLIFLIPFLFIPLLFSQNSVITFNYIDLTKREIMKDLNYTKFYVSERLWVIVDSNSQWKLSDEYYSYLFDFQNGERLSTTYNSKTTKCISYVWDYTSYNNYYGYIDFFNKYLHPTGKVLTWVDKNDNGDIIFILYPNGNKKGGFTLYVYEK